MHYFSIKNLLFFATLFNYANSYAACVELRAASVQAEPSRIKSAKKTNVQFADPLIQETIVFEKSPEQFFPGSFTQQKNAHRDSDHFKQRVLNAPQHLRNQLHEQMTADEIELEEYMAKAERLKELEYDAMNPRQLAFEHAPEKHETDSLCYRASAALILSVITLTTFVMQLR